MKPRLLILDEPTSVLTPQEADEVLGVLRDRAHAGDVSIILITHKFREVMSVADDVSVLRRGRLMGSHRVVDVAPEQLGAEMMGQANLAAVADAEKPAPSIDGTATEWLGAQASPRCVNAFAH